MNVHCECGEATGERCNWTGPLSDTVMVEWMPEWLRSSHAATGNSGIYPFNGAIRFRAYRSCAQMIADYDPVWTDIL